MTILAFPPRLRGADSIPTKYYELRDDALSVGGLSPRRGDICLVSLGAIVEGELHIVDTGCQILCGYLHLERDYLTLTFPNPDYPAYRRKRCYVNIVGRAVRFFCATEGQVNSGLYLPSECYFFDETSDRPGEVEVVGPELPPPAGTWKCDPTGKITFMSDEWLAKTGLSLEDYTSDRYIQFIPSDQRDGFVRRWTHSLQTGAVYQHAAHTTTPTGLRAVCAVAVPVKDGRQRITSWAGTLHLLSP